MGNNRGRVARWLLVSLTVGLAGCAAQVPHSTGSAPMPDITSVGQAPAETSAPLPQPRAQATTSVVTDFNPASVAGAAKQVEKRATVGALVVDRTTGDALLEINADRQFRSASLVKLLIAIDALARDDDAKLARQISYMLSMSDDDTASALWVAGGGASLVTRTSARLGLTGTEPPKILGRWGDVLLTAHDVGRIYEFVLTELPDAHRTLIVDALANAPRKASDGFDQHFGIPDGLGGTWAIKQGWSNSTNDIVLHSTGLVGDGWRYVVVLLTEHPLGVSWAVAAQSVTSAAKALSPLL